MSVSVFFSTFFSSHQVNGSWSEWQKLDTCSVTCGNGTRNYQRLCNNPAPQNGGLRCPGPHMKTENCTNPACPGKMIISSFIIIQHINFFLFSFSFI